MSEPVYLTTSTKPATILRMDRFTVESSVRPGVARIIDARNSHYSAFCRVEEAAAKVAEFNAAWELRLVAKPVVEVYVNFTSGTAHQFVTARVGVQNNGRPGVGDEATYTSKLVKLDKLADHIAKLRATYDVRRVSVQGLTEATPAARSLAEAIRFE